MKNVALILLFVVLTSFIIFKNNNQSSPEIIKPEQLKEWISFLASDQMRGRKNGSEEMKQAADWISDKYSEYGLKPLAPSGEYFQKYTYTARQTEIKEQNVIGYIEGTDPVLKKEYIILSAHFDHLGIRRGSQPDSIFNGADDNAAGTATIIAIAEYIRKSGLKPGRSIVFAAFSGEENGIRGSRFFVANSPIPLKNIYADLNFEMTGHSEYLGRNNYYMTGCNLSNLDDLIGEFDKDSGFKLIDTIQIAKSLFYQSDNIAFSRIKTTDNITQGIPSGTFATTTMAGYIHNTSDEVQLFDFENMAALVNHFSNLVLWLSKNKAEVNWTDPKYVRPE